MRDPSDPVRDPGHHMPNPVIDVRDPPRDPVIHIPHPMLDLAHDPGGVMHDRARHPGPGTHRVGHHVGDRMRNRRHRMCDRIEDERLPGGARYIACCFCGNTMGGSNLLLTVVENHFDSPGTRLGPREATRLLHPPVRDRQG